jgi:hypothetical protein
VSAGVKIYDVNTEQRITFIDRPKGSPKADLYRCSLCWEDPHTLLIGWADMVRIAVIKARCLPSFIALFFLLLVVAAAAVIRSRC